MVSSWFIQLGDRNPQLLREVKGRMKRRHVLVTVAVSLVTQWLILGHYWHVIGSTDRQSDSAVVLRDAWFQVFDALTWVAMLALLFLCSYLLVKDFAKERQQGTLDFVRLSPVSAHTVLVGKLLGVPILVYLAIALALPFHLWAAIQAGLSLGLIVSVYLLAVTAYGFVSSFMLLYSVSRNANEPVWFMSLIPCLVSLPLYGIKVGANYHYQVAVAQATIATGSFEPEQGFFVVTRYFSIMFAGLAFGSWWASLRGFYRLPLRR